MGEIQSLSFLSPGNFPDADPYRGLEDTLRLFEYGEGFGFDGAWSRQRHLEHGVSSGAVFLAAAAQRTSRVELNTSARAGVNLLSGNILAPAWSHRASAGTPAGQPPPPAASAAAGAAEAPTAPARPA